MPSGELWRRQAQIGRESVPGSAVAATRRAYLDQVSFTRTRAPREYRFATGTRDNRRRMTLGPIEAAGSATIPLSAPELLEWLAVTMKAGVTPTTPAGGATARDWVFTPGDLDSMTCEYHDGARIWQAAGVRGNGLTISGSVQEQLTAQLDLFATALNEVGALTPGLPERVPDIYEGWEANVYLDNFNVAPGTTLVDGQAANWEVALGNNLTRKYLANNSKEARRIIAGQLDTSAKLTLEAVDPQAAAEYANWDATVPRNLRLAFGFNQVLDAGTNEVQTITITGAPTGGTFTLSFNPGGGVQTTAAIPYNATASQVLAALLGLDAFVGGDLAVSGGAFPGTAVAVAYQGRYSGTNVPQLTATSSLTGGTAPTATVATTTPGVTGYKAGLFVDIPGYWDAADLSAEDQGTRAMAFSLLGVYEPALATALRVTARCERTQLF